MSNGNKDPLGTTLAFPLQVENGKLKTLSGVEAIESHMRTLVLAERGSHKMNPGLGWRIKELVAVGDLDQINRAIKQALIDQEPRIDHSNLDVAAAPQNGALGVVIEYSIKNEAGRRTLKIDVPLDTNIVASEINS